MSKKIIGFILQDENNHKKKPKNKPFRAYAVTKNIFGYRSYFLIYVENGKDSYDCSDVLKFETNEEAIRVFKNYCLDIKFIEKKIYRSHGYTDCVMKHGHMMNMEMTINVTNYDYM
jgi:hypothetical protein